MDLFKLFGRIAIVNDDANTAIDETTGKAKNLGDALDGAGSSADTASSKMGGTSKFNSAAVWLGNTLSAVTEKAVEVGTSLAKIGFGFNASMESYQYQFKALLGDSDKAAQLVADLQELAKISPLGLEGLANNAVTLLQQSIELADIIPTLEMLGNLSLGDTEHMNSVVRAYTQILGKGGLMAQEMYQLGDAMVPIVEIMTKYGGERYADGSWYQEKMTDPTFKIPAEDMVAAFQAATAEGGKWHDYMLVIMDTFAGQYDRLGEEGKETLGAFFQPFFDMAKTDVLPNLTASLESFRTWISENKETLDKMADAVGNLVSSGFDKILDAFKWLTENGEATGAALGVIATGLAIGAIAAHPYAAAITAIAVGLAALVSEGQGLSNGSNYDKMFDRFSDEELITLQNYVDAVNAAREAEEAYVNSGFDETLGKALDDANAKKKQAFDAASAIDDLIATYDAWRSAQATNQGKDIYLDVPVFIADGSEAAIQSELGNMTFEALVHMYPDLSAVYNSLGSGTLIPHVTSDERETVWRAEGAIFSKPTIFNTRLGMQGVGEAGAEAVAPISKLQSYVSDAVRSTVGGLQLQVVLDTGVLVGQIAPKMDMQLGTLASRKGRGN